MTPIVGALSVLWGVLSGWGAAWFVHRYHEALDDDGYEVAALGDAACPHCGAALSFGEAAPLRSVACPRCGGRLPATWSLVPLACVAASVGMFVTFGAAWPLIPFLWLVPVLIAAAAIDIRTFLIPKRVVWVGYGVGLALIVAASFASKVPQSVVSALVGSVGYFVILFITNLINPAGMGFGDVRLSALLGLYLGWIDIRLPLYGLILACAIGLVAGLAKRARATTPEERAFPFGPGLAGGTFLAVWLYSVIPTLGA